MVANLQKGSIGCPKSTYLWSKMAQNAPKWSLANGDDRKRMKNTKKVERNGFISPLNLHRVKCINMIIFGIFFKQFCIFRSFSVISIAQASFWCILSHFRPKLATFRATDTSKITTISTDRTKWLLDIIYKFALRLANFGLNWLKMYQNEAKGIHFKILCQKSSKS